MTTSYAVIQYTPDPATGECLNVGIVAWDGTNTHCKFTNNWRRIRAIASSDLSYLIEFSEYFSNVVLRYNTAPTEEERKREFFSREIQPLSEHWASKIRFTQPKGSLRDASATVNSLSHIFLSVIAADGVRRRTRSTAVSLTVKALRSAVVQRLSTQASQDHVVLKPEIQGEFESHTLDVGLRNGQLLSGVHALSFESQDPVHLDREVESTAYVINDVMKSGTGIPVSVFVLPPNKATEKAVVRAEKLFQAMRVPVIEENGLERWAAKQADDLAIHVE